MIDEKKLIEEFRKCYSGHSGMENSDSLIMFKSVCRIINNQPKIGEWIPCSERLPDKSKSYLVTKHIEESEYNVEMYVTCSEIFWITDENWDCERDSDYEWQVIAWQPLPDAYKECD